MRGLLQAIRSLMNSVRLVWVKAADGLGYVLQRVVDFDAHMSEHTGDGIDPVVRHVMGEDKDRHCEDIRLLAVHILNGTDTAEMYAKVGDRDAAWLGVVSRIGLSRIVCASDVAIKEHMSGGLPIRGVCAADPESVAAMIQRMALDELDAIPAVIDRSEALIASANAPRPAFA